MMTKAKTIKTDAGAGAHPMESVCTEIPAFKPVATTDGAATPSEFAMPSEAPNPTPKPESKRSMVLNMLQNEEGAHINELIAATDWLPHTIRATLSGLRKQGHTILATKGEAGTVYHLHTQNVEA